MKKVGINKIFTILLLALIVLPVSVFSAVLDWDVNTWPAPVGGVPTLTQTYTIGGGDVTVTIAGDTGALTTTATGTAASPQTNTRNTGGIVPAENSLLIRMDFPEGTPAVDEQEITVTYTFSHPGGVNIPQFQIFDVDTSSSNQFTDVAIATGVLATGGTINPTSIVSSTANTNDGINTATGTGASGGTSGAGNVTFGFGQSGVSSFTFTYRNSAPNTVGSHLQAASIHDINFFVAPTVNKTFSPNVITSGGVSTLTLTLGNNETTHATLSSDLVDTFPVGVTVASPANIGGTCPGTVNASAGGNTVTYLSGSVIPVGNCTITVDVTSNSLGTYTNTIDIGDLQTNFGNNTVSSSDNLTVNAGGGSASCPSGQTLSTPSPNPSYASAQTNVGVSNPSNALGAYSAAGSAANNGNSANLRANDILRLDLADTLAQNSSVILSLARDNSSGNVNIAFSDDGNNEDVQVGTFGSGGTLGAGSVDVLSHIALTVPGDGYRYLIIRRLNGRNWVDGVSYDQICVSPPTADLAITKDDGSLAYTPGGTSTYTIIVTNNGPDDVTGATIADDLPNGVTMTAPWTCTPSSGSSSCNTAPNTTDPISIDVDIVNGDSITVTVPVQFSTDMNDY